MSPNMKMESSVEKLRNSSLVLCALNAGFIRSLPDILKSTHDHKYEQMLVFGEMVIMFIRRCESTALLSDISHTVYAERLDVHKSYLKFRQKRKQLRDKNKKIEGLELSDTLKNYAQTGTEYTKILNQIITQNDLTDFERVRLVNSVKQVELNS